MLALLMHLQHG